MNTTVVTTDEIQYCDIESDISSYIDESDIEGEETDEDLREMSTEEKEDAKYLSIFENEYNDFNEKLMSVESTEWQ